ncbi:MAG: hypothetical protein WC070_01975 [Candidatus Magasanikbacteria bacterium]
MNEENTTTNKTFRIYNSVIIFDILWLSTTLIITLFLFSSTFNITSIFLGIFSLAFTIFMIIKIIKDASYKIILDNNILKEYNYSAPTLRSIEIKDITHISQVEYSVLEEIKQDKNNSPFIQIINQILSKIFTLLLKKSTEHTDMPMFVLQGNFKISRFPSVPVNIKLIQRLIELNPSIIVDKKLRRWLPKKLQKQLNMHPTKLEYTFEIIGKILISILIVLIILWAIPLTFFLLDKIGILNTIQNLIK